MVPPTNKVTFNTFAILAARIIDILAGLVIVVLVARYLGVTGFGDYAYIAALVGITVSVTYFGLERIAIREISRDKDKANESLGGILVVRWALSALVSLAIAGYLLVSSLPATHAIAIIVATVSELIWASGSVYSCAFKAFEEMHLETVTTLVFRISSLLLIGLVILFGGGIVMLFAATCGANIVRTVTAIYYAKSLSVIPLIKVDFPLWIRYAKEAFVLGIVVVLCLGTIKTGVIALKYLRDARDVALFQSSQTVVLQMQILPMSIAMALFPMLSKMGVSEPDRLARVSNTILKYLFIVSVPIAIVLHVFSETVISIVFGRDYSAAVAVLSTMAWCVIPLFLTSLIEFILISMNRQQDIAKAWLITFFVNALLNYLLIRAFGAWGAGIAVLGSLVLLAMIQYLFLMYHLKNTEFLRMLSKLLAPLGLIILFLYGFQLDGWYYRVMGATSAIVFFIAALFMTATISLNEIKTFAKKTDHKES